MSTILPSRTDDAVAFLTERAQAAADALADAQWEREQIVERHVTFADLLEELTDLGELSRAIFMLSVARGNRDDLHLIHCALSEAKQRIVKRRMAQGE
jgi:hypothetical protein